ncbi:G5 domain-containing protein [Micromonospora sp. NBC_01405]|uniref:G5 domain-containing protein n=1 Tax=Micromonospora sp. NBC_01405 TaxID=2903589 RepID=UPI00324E6B8A
MTHQPPYHPSQPFPGPPASPATRSRWLRWLPSGQRAGVVLGGVLLASVLTILTVLGTLVNDPQQDRTPAATGAGQAGNSPVASPVATAEPVVSDAPSAASEPSPAPATASPSPTVAVPTVKTRTETKTQPIRHAQRTVKDPSLAKGKRVVRTPGVDGVRTLTYRVTLADGVPTGRKLVRSVVTRRPVAQIVAVGTKQERECDPNYGGCVPIASDVDCTGGSGNGPAYVTGPVRVIGDDIYDLDRDNDGYGCDD